MKLRLVSKNGGKELLPREQLKLVRAFTTWVLKKFVSDRLADEVSIRLCFDGHLLEKERDLGQSIWEDRSHRPREFTVVLDATVEFQNIMHTLAHELTHVKQWVLGEFFQRARWNNGDFVYRGETYDSTVMNYYDLPWEVEAEGRSMGLLRQWIKETGQANSSWVKTKISFDTFA